MNQHITVLSKDPPAQVWKAPGYGWRYKVGSKGLGGFESGAAAMRQARKAILAIKRQTKEQ